jgi:hypothetical protein
MKSYKTYLTSIIATASLFSCNDLLEETVYSELTTDTYLNTTEAKQTILTSAYGNSQLREYFYFYGPGMTSGETWNEFGAIETHFTPLCNFTWVSTHEYFSSSWNKLFSVVRDANIVLAAATEEAGEGQLIAEAKFLRAFAYDFLHDWFGPLPIYKTPDDDHYQERASEDATVSFIEQDLKDAASALPVRQDTYGKATKGAALGILTKLYLNTKQWQKAAETAKQIMDLNNYALFPDYTKLFLIENEGNSELIWVIPANPQAGIPFPANTFPTDYPHLPNQTIYASRVYHFDKFVNSFDEADARKELFVTSYVNTSGQLIVGLGNDRNYALKYEFDKDALGASYGDDLPVIRYADILLSRAEALNELNGPNEESISLVNQVRTRAGVKPLELAGYTKETLRDAIFQERDWELYFEQKSRQDRIRQGNFVSGAQARGKTAAKPHHVLFPLPQSELDANPNLKQNEGY